MKVALPEPTLRETISSALREGVIPLEIARRLGVPLLLVAEVVLWASTGAQSGESGAGYGASSFSERASPRI